MRKKIMHMIFSLTTGGSENLLLDLVNRQSEFAEVHLVIVNKHYSPALLEQIDKNVKVHLINRRQGSKNLLKIYKVNKLIARIRPAVIHCHNHDLINLIFRHRSKTLLTVHALTEDIADMKKYAGIVAISDAVKEDIESRSQQTIHVDVVYNAIDFDKVEVKSVFTIEGKVRIVQVGRLMHSVKGQDILIDAIRLLVKERGIENIHVDIIGDGDSKTFLQKQIKSNGLDKFVDILAAKDRRWLYPNLKNYHMLIQPSRMEGFGLTVIEGMAAKLPVIVSNIHGPKEIVCDGKYGELFESENAIDLANKIEKLISEYEQNKIALKVEEAYSHARHSYSMDKMIRDYSEVYQNFYEKAGQVV